MGTLEIVIFPKDYEKNSKILELDNKGFVRGRVSGEDEKNSKLSCERMYAFDDTKKELWLQFDTVEEYTKREPELFKLMRDSDGQDGVVIYISSVKQMKRLPPNRSIRAEAGLVNNLTKFLGEKNVKVVEKCIENTSKRY